jgi:hypothetical protein
MVAERGNETIRSTRASALIAVAKAKIFIEEGWKTHITDEHGRNFEPAEFHLLPAMRDPVNRQPATLPPALTPTLRNPDSHI